MIEFLASIKEAKGIGFQSLFVKYENFQFDWKIRISFVIYIELKIHSYLEQ